MGKTTMEDYQNCFVAWPANRVVFDSESSIAGSSKAVSSTSKNQKSPLSAKATEKSGTSVRDQSRNDADSPLTPPAPTKIPAATMKVQSPVIPASPLRRSEVLSFLELLDWFWL